MNTIFKNFHLSWNSFIEFLPALLAGIVCFILTLFIGHFISNLSSKFSLKKTKDTLVANFIGKIVLLIIIILGTVMALSIIGLGSISNKILAGAGLTTFVIGFALKDIGENFLAGIVLAFSRPYKVGSLIECEDVKGIVKNMTMRQTTVEASNGIITMIPNSMILKNPLNKYLNSDNNLRQEFFISIENAKVKQAIKIIHDTLLSNNTVKSNSENTVKIIVDSLVLDKVKLLVVFWFDTTTFKGSRSGTKTDIMLAVIDKLNEAEIKFVG